MGDNYNERVQKLFERVGNIQSAVDEEKSTRLKEIETVLVELEKKLNGMKDGKNEKILLFEKMVILVRHRMFLVIPLTIQQIKEIHSNLEEESENRQKLENELNSQITALEKNCQRVLEEASKVE